VNAADPDAPALSWAVTVTGKLAATSSGMVPEITPVEELIDRPAGSPDAV
jgi:hypothetical protein